jgi:hypothetical protein
MLDLSKGGASFRYIPYEDLAAFAEFDIVTRNLELALEGIPYRVISDCAFKDALSSLKLRRCGVEFGTLTCLQESLLDEFIKNYAVGVRLDHYALASSPNS